ncbi:hypothetical protein [Acidomonas methanolica]|uniref:hypothetical protein n=1 Tax=Acidomonas methanolica TaxID=437 RepID=UPI002119D047|nr:hypothetical protein [Acidomonas methanolica]
MRNDYTDTLFTSRWTPHPALDRKGRFWALTIYVLYIFAFFTVITAPIGAFLAYRHRFRHGPLLRASFDWQIRIFWTGLFATLAIALTHTIVTGLAAITFGAGAVLMVVPWAMTAVWWLWTAWAILRGLAAVE